MNKFAMGMSTYLSFTENLSRREMQKIGLSPSDRNKLVNAEYTFKMGTTDKNAIAQFAFHEELKDNKTTVTHHYNYHPDVERMPLADVVECAAHEADHSKRQKWHGIQYSKYRLLGSFIAGIATALKVYNKMDEIGAIEFAPLMGFGLPAIAGAFVGFATNKLTKNLISYADEKKAYTHQGVVSAAFNPTASTPDALKRNKKDLLEKRGFTEQTFDVLFRKGYPSETTRKLWIQNGKMLAHEAGLTQPGKLNNYIAAADKNIKNRHYNFND